MKIPNFKAENALVIMPGTTSLHDHIYTIDFFLKNLQLKGKKQEGHSIAPKTTSANAASASP